MLLRVQLRDAFCNACSGGDALGALPLSACITGGSGAAAAVEVLPLPHEGAFDVGFVAPASPGLYRLELYVALNSTVGAGASARGAVAAMGSPAAGQTKGRAAAEQHLPGSPFSLRVVQHREGGFHGVWAGMLTHVPTQLGQAALQPPVHECISACILTMG